MFSTTTERRLQRSQTIFIHISLSLFLTLRSFAFLYLSLPSSPFHYLPLPSTAPLPPLPPYSLVKDGLTALLMAAQNGHWEVVSTLLDGGADASIASEVRTYVHTRIHTHLHAYVDVHTLCCLKPHYITLYCTALYGTAPHCSAVY